MCCCIPSPDHRQPRWEAIFASKNSITYNSNPQLVLRERPRIARMVLGGTNETSPPPIPAIGRMRCRAPGHAQTAWAQAYPARPVRVVVPVAAGGANDVTARLIGQWLSERLGQQFVIENRPGAGTNIGTEAVIRAPADGYTLLIAGSNAAINATLFEIAQLQFHP